MINKVLLIQYLLVGLSFSARVPLVRKATGMGAQANIDRVTEKLNLLQNTDIDPLLNLVSFKNVDDRSPGIQKIMQDYMGQNKHEKHYSFLSHVMKLITGEESFLSLFASKAAGPGLHEKPFKVGEIDFSDFESATGTGDREMWDKAYEVFSRLEDERYKNMAASQGHHGPRVRGDSRIDLSNSLNFQYTGPMYMGSIYEKMTLIYDTGSDWLAVDTDFCTTCIQPVFNTGQSSTYANTSDTIINQRYGSANLYAVSATDQVSPDNTAGTRLSSFNFLGISAQVGIQQTFDGILGMSRQMSLPEENFATGPLLVDKMKQAGLITQEVSSFFITNFNEQSFCDLGAFVPSNIRNSDISKIFWLKQKPNVLFWYSSISGVVYDDPENKKMSKVGFTSQIRFNSTPAIFDTGTSLIYVPQSVADDFMYRLVYGKKYIYSNGIFQVNCKQKDQFEDVSLVIADKLFQVAAKDYVIELEGVCILAFVVHTQDFWLLGDAFLMGYYSIHDNNDHDDAYIGIAPHKDSTKPDIIDFPADKIKETFQSTAWEKTWIYDFYWFWQLEWFAGIPLLDSDWMYYPYGWTWNALFGGQSVVINVFTEMASALA